MLKLKNCNNIFVHYGYLFILLIKYHNKRKRGGGQGYAPCAACTTLDPESVLADLQTYQRICGPHWNVVFADR
jgi:hypothetical protein